MASQPSVTNVTQKRGAKLPKVKSDVGEIPFPGGLALREIDAVPTQGAEDSARPSLSEADIALKIHPGGARPKLLPVRFQQTVQVADPDPEPGPQLDETNPWSHASMLLHTSASSRSSSSPHQPGKSPSRAMGPLLLETRMTRGVARGRHGTNGTRSGVKAGKLVGRPVESGKEEIGSEASLPPFGYGATGGVGRQITLPVSQHRLEDPPFDRQLDLRVPGVLTFDDTRPSLGRGMFVSADAQSVDYRGREVPCDMNGKNNYGEFIEKYREDYEVTRTYTPPIMSSAVKGIGTTFAAPPDRNRLNTYEDQSNRVISVADSVEMRTGRASTNPWCNAVDDGRHLAFPLRTRHSEDGFHPVDAFRPWDHAPPLTTSASWPPSSLEAPSGPYLTSTPGLHSHHLRSTHVEDNFRPVDALRPRNLAHPLTASASGQPPSLGAALTPSAAFTSGPRAYPVREVYPEDDFLPVDAHRPWDRVHPSSALAPCYRPQQNVVSTTSVASALGLFASCPPGYVLSGDARPNTTSSRFISGVIPSSLGSSGGPQPQILTHVGGGQWVITEPAIRDSRPPRHTEPITTLSNPFQCASGDVLLDTELVVRPTDEARASLHGRPAPSTEGYPDHHNPTPPQTSSSSGAESTGALPVSSGSSSVTGAVTADVLLPADFRAMFRRCLAEELGKTADKEMSAVLKEDIDRVPSAGTAVSRITAGSSATTAVTTSPTSAPVASKPERAETILSGSSSPP